MKRLLSFFVLSLMGFGAALAAPPGSPFNLGETLDPACAPEDLNCTVVTPAASGINTDITKLDGISDIWIGADEASVQNTDGLAQRALNSEVTDTSTDTGWIPYHFFNSYVEPTADQALDAGRASLYSWMQVPASNTSAIEYMNSVGGEVTNEGTGDIGILQGILGYVDNTADAFIGSMEAGTFNGFSDDGDVLELTGVRIDSGATGGDVADFFGLYVPDLFIDGATVENRYGIYLGDFFGTPNSDDYGIYQEGAQDNYFGGYVGIGTDDPDVPLHVYGQGGSNGEGAEIRLGDSDNIRFYETDATDTDQLTIYADEGILLETDNDGPQVAVIDQRANDDDAWFFLDSLPDSSTMMGINDGDTIYFYWQDETGEKYKASLTGSILASPIID